MIRITDTMIGHAAQVVREMLKFAQPADAVLSNFFRANRVDSRSRAFIAETAYTVLRRRRLLEKVVGERPTPLRLVLAALVKVTGLSQRQVGEVLGDDGGREASWLASLKGQPDPELTLAEQADLPDWLAERLAQRMAPDEVLALARGLNQPAPLDLRVNEFKAKRDTVLAQLLADGFVAQPCPLAPDGIRVEGRPALSKHPLYIDGTIEVQDEGSQLLGHLLAPKRGEMVVDFCAGAGGKTLALGALMRSSGRLYAFDVAEKRLAKLKPRVARSGLSNVHPVLISGENDIKVKRLAGKIDRVLVDAPCSGLGTLRRNPDLKWRQTPESVAELTRKQSDILAGAARLVKPGGRLVYATCSILPEENEGVVNAFLAAHPEFVRMSPTEILAKQGVVLVCGEDMQLLPHRHGTDGFYAAVLERSK
ncbi:MAG: RsmB/NOP family class I SAM-dependent RNA methyltransferase [Gammaproteobacteria bacterium]|nr:RsmB/NOP family class I SAM-dependent RNA methyltransferase [Gammaproteobacteria bacterium]MBU1646226.1 RsmB/NOP family class I SAM-dependent RNA methyltransferase [Gammaproteobacteria bacterium]MBU1970766.1 RsmB/NOP family class I SAM-dependent RNA methyltransferase [Gammaproteobacteria bacterium]